MRAMLRYTFLLLAGLTGLPGQSAAAPDGETVYLTHCAVCHATGAARAPAFELLASMTPDAIVRALETGAMRVLGTFDLNGPERVAVAEYITGKSYDAAWQSQAVHACAQSAWVTTDAFSRPHWNGWGGPRNWRYQPPEMAGITPTEVPDLELQWAFAFPGETVTEAHPTVTAGRLFTGSRSGTVYAMDAVSGCVHWTFQADAAVKTPVVVGPVGKDGRLAAFFGDLGGRVYAVDARSGAFMWKMTADRHVAARIVGGFQLVDDALFVPVSSFEEGSATDPNYACCTFRGSLLKLDPATGAVDWKRYTINDLPTVRGTSGAGQPVIGPSGGAVWSSPTIDPKTRRIYVSTSDNYTHPETKTSDAIIAIAMDSGEIVWSYQGLAGDVWNTSCSLPDKTNCPEEAGPDHDMGSSSILVTLPDGQRVLAAGQKNGVVHAVDPDRDGQLLWKKRVANGGIIGGIEWGPASDGATLFVAISDIRWQDQDFISATTKIDPSAGGGLVALDLRTGETLWEAPPVSCEGRERCSPAQSAAVTVTPGLVWSGSVSGVMRAFDAKTGAVVWAYDTVRDFDTVNGAVGRGGAIDGPGPVIVGGRVYLTSGYSKWGALGGNVLLSFAPAKH